MTRASAIQRDPAPNRITCRAGRPIRARASNAISHQTDSWPRRDCTVTLYNVLKVLHVAAMFVWLSTLLIVPLVAFARCQGAGDRSEALLRLRRFFAGVGTPAMLATFALGLAMAQQAGWFVAVWLQIKLVMVLALAALHGAVAGQLR